MQYYQVHTVIANTNMAGTRTVCSINMVNFGGARSALVAWWLARRTLKPADQDRFLGGHLLNIFFFFFLSFIKMNYFLPVIQVDINDKKYTP